MPVLADEFVKIRDWNGKEVIGKAIGTDLVCVETEDGEKHFGLAVSLDHIHTKVVCDNEKCENSTVNDKFETTPKTLEFDNNGDSDSATFLKDISSLVVVSDFKGVKTVFCTAECYHAFTKRQHREQLAEVSSGKGSKTSFAE